MNLHVIVPDEATIRIVNPKSELFHDAPEELKKPYWVTLGEGYKCDAAFNTIEEAEEFIKTEALNAQRIS
jgi:hypothetical protein